MNERFAAEHGKAAGLRVPTSEISHYGRGPRASQSMPLMSSLQLPLDYFWKEYYFDMVRREGPYRGGR
jgi:hypothetical protein